MEAKVGARISVGGGYDVEPPWLGGSVADEKFEPDASLFSSFDT